MGKRIFKLLVLLLVLTSAHGYAQEGTKQFMPIETERLWLEFNVFDQDTGFAMYGCTNPEKRINIRLKKDEKMFFGMKLSPNYVYDSWDSRSNITNASQVFFKIITPSGGTVTTFNDVNVPSSGAGFISSHSQAVAGPTGVNLNGVPISGGYTPFSFTANETGDYYIVFREDSWKYRFALEFFDVTVTDASNNIITNPGAPNVSAGRLWSKAWQMTTTSFTGDNKVNSYFYVFTSDEFINKINFQSYPYSFIFQSNSYGLVKPTTTPTSTNNYILNAQSKETNQTQNSSEYKIFLNDPDRGVWPNTRLVPPIVQVWADNNLFFDYSYTRTPAQQTFPSNTINLEKNRPGCTFNSIAIFKINSNIDGFTAILIDLNGGGYSTGGSDRVIYRNMKKGNNYILWDFKSDAGAEIPVGTYHATATFLGRGPTHFPMYDVEQLDGVQTAAVRPFKKLNNTIYWDDTYITRWGDETGGGQMNETQKKQLVINSKVPRTWSWNSSLENTRFNGNLNTLNTWYNAIDLGYSDITINVTQSATKCEDGLAPYVGDIYKDTLPNRTVRFKQIDFTKKFFDPTEKQLATVKVLNLPANGVLKLGVNAVTAGQEITYAQLVNLTFEPTTNWIGRTSFDYTAKNSSGKWSMNQDKVYITINTPPTGSAIPDQRLCTNTPSPIIPFTVGDGSETPAGNLTVTAFSADPTFVPNSAIIIGGAGANRTVQVTPVANKSGSAIVYIMVDDGLSQAIQEFAVYTSPDLEFSGDTTVCVGQALTLTAQETGASSYAWKYNGVTVTGGTSKTLNKAWGSFNQGNWSLTITKGTCTSTRNFQVLISPLTTFIGDPNVCVGEPIALSAVENNATYEWKRGTTIISSTKQYAKASAQINPDNANTYTLKVTKDGCTATSPQFAISVIARPTTGLTLIGSTVNPGTNGTITVTNAQNNFIYNVYKSGVFVTSGLGLGANLNISVPAANLAIGSNVFEVSVSNANCELPLSPNTVTITVREPGITVSPISGNTTEAGTNATFTVVLKTQPNASVTIPVSSSDITEGTLSISNVVFTTVNWNTPQTVTVTRVDDVIIDGNITYSINIGASSSADPYYTGIDPTDLTLSNIDNDIAAVNVTPTSGLTTTELGGTATFTVRLACQPTADVTFTLSSNNPAEGTVAPTGVTFTSATWNTPQTITITGKDDLIDDGDVDYAIITSQTSSGDGNFQNLTVADVSVKNINNDVAGVTVNPTSGLTTYESGSPSATFTIKLNSEPTQSVSISLSSSNTSEGNVSPTSVVFNSTNWGTAQTLTITGVNDDFADGNITYSIVTSNASSTDTKYSNMVVADVSVLNTDDDVAGVIVPTTTFTTTEIGGTATVGIRLRSKPTADVTIGLSSSNTLEGNVSPTSLIFTTDNWNTNQSFTVTGVNDFVADGDQTYYVVTSNSSSTDGNYNNKPVDDIRVINQDNDVAGITVTPTEGLTTTEGGGIANFNIVLTSQPTGSVTIGLTSSNTAEGTVSPASVTFTNANWNTPQTVTVTGVNDAAADGPQPYIIYTATASSSDPKYSVINPSDVSVTNNDNDVAGITVTPTSLSTTEGGSTTTFSIVLNTKPTSSVSISLTSNNTNEGTISSSSVTFTSENWNTPQSITVTPVNDDVADGPQLYTIVTAPATSGDGNYNGFNPSDVSVTNNDNDTAGFIFSQTTGLTTTEVGGTAIVYVRLSSKPTVNVTFTLTSSKPAEGTVSPSPITFTPANWNTNQPITITGVDELIDDDNADYTIITTNTTVTEPKYTGMDISDLFVTNTDNDIAGVTITPTTVLTTYEAGAGSSFTVKLNTQPTANVTIAINSNNINEGVASPTLLTFTSSTWNTPQTVNITSVDDDIDDGNVDYKIITGNASSVSDTKYNGMDVPDVSVTNTNNDFAGFTLSRTSGLVTTEGGGSDSFTIKLNTRPTADVTVGLTSSNTAEGTVSELSVTFNSSDWGSPKTVTVTGVNDDFDDDDVKYNIITAQAVSADTKYSAINPSDVEVTNTDNDVAGFTVNPTGGLVTKEGGINTSFTVRLTTIPKNPVVIDFFSSNTLEGDVNPKKLTFNAGNWNANQVVNVLSVDDNKVDGPQIYTINSLPAVSDDPKYNGKQPLPITATNNDNDVVGIIVNPTSGLVTTEAGGKASFDVSLSSEPYSNVVITVTSSIPSEGIPSPATLTFTPANWNVIQKVTVTGQNDDIDDGDVAYSIIKQSVVSLDPAYNNANVLSVSITNTDDDEAGYLFSTTNISYTESDAPVVVNVSLKSEPLSNVKFDVVSENTLKGTVIPAFLEFTSANWDVNQTITVTPVNNFIQDGNTAFNIVTSAPTTGDTKYSVLNPSDISVSVTDDDVAAINVSAISGNVREDGTGTFTVVLNSEPTANVTIAVASSNTGEGTVSVASLEFTPGNWNSPQMVTVTGVNDAAVDGNKTYSIILSPAVSADDIYNTMDPADVTVVSIDIHQAGFNIFPISGLETKEAGQTATFSVSLNTNPNVVGTNVIMNFVSSDLSEGTVSPASITFTNATWNIPQTITLTGVDDVDNDGDIAYSIAVTVDPSSTAAEYKSLGVIAPVSATNLDDVAPRPVNDNATTDEDTPITFDVTTNDLGLDKGVKTVSITTQPINGTVVVEADNRVTYTPNGLFNGVETFAYRVTDNSNAFGEANVNMTVTFVNDVPVANKDSLGTSINTPVVIAVLTNDSGMEDGGIVVSVSEVPDLLVGTATPNAGNTVTFTPAPGYLGIATFKYKITDANADESKAIIKVTVRTVNHVPNAVDDIATTIINTAKSINVLANDSGLEDNFSAIKIQSNPSNGTVLINANRTVTYTPSSGFIGVDNFQYLLIDMDGDNDVATVTVTVTDKPNYLPVAKADSVGTSFNTAVKIDVLTNDTGLEDGIAEITIISDPVSGNYVINPGFTITYTPNPGFIGTETFSYQVCDIDGDCSSANITVKVKEGVNLVPIAVDDKDSTYINTSKAINVLKNDSDLGDGFKRLFISKNPEFGSVAVNTDRTVTYTPTYMFIGTETFQYRIEDIDGDDSLATVTVLVKDKPNFIPIAFNDERGCSFNQPVTVEVLFNDKGLDDSPVVVSVKTGPTKGSALPNADNTITFTPETGFVGIMTFTYTVTDADGDSDDAIVTINVKSGENIVPVAVNDNATTIINQSVEINVLGNDSGLEDGFRKLDIITNPAYGTAVVTASRTIIYTPSYMYLGTENFQYFIEDADGDISVATVTVTVTERPNYLPIANDDRSGCSFDTPVTVNVLLNDTELHDTPLVVTITQNPDKGTAVPNPDGTVTYTPEPGFIGESFFYYQVADVDGDFDDAKVTITVKPGLNYVPTAVDDNATTLVNKPVDIVVLANDTGLNDGFGDLRIHKQPLFGKVIVNANRSVTYTPSYMYIGVETFQYIIEDADGDNSVATVTVTISDRPDYQPIANDDRRGCSFNQSEIIDVLFNDKDLFDTPVTVSIKTNPTQGTVNVNPTTNKVTFTPTTGFIGVTTFEYTVTDVDGDYDDATVTVNVKSGINFVPVAVDDNATTVMNKPVDINVLANDTGLDDGFGAIVIHKFPLFGTVTVNSNRTITYTPSYMFIGTEIFQYYVEDVDGDLSLATVTVNVIDRPNYLPIANDDRNGCSFNSSKVVNVLFNDSGLDDTPIVVTISTNPTTGTALPNPDGTITYTSTNDFIGEVTFRYTVTDVDGDSDDALVTIRVKEGENIEPKAFDDIATTYINQSVDINVLANDTGLEDGFEILSIHKQPQFGNAVVNANRTITYTPSYMFVGAETFQYYIQDVDGDFSVATVTVTVTERPDFIPIANDDYRGATYNTPRIVDILINDTGLEDAPITVLKTTDPEYGTIAVNADNTITYTPNGTYLGPVQFKYSITDLDGDTDDATVFINVKVKNMIPEAYDDIVTTLVNTPVDVHVLENDSMLYEGIKGLHIHVAPKWGTTVVNTDNTITYTPSSWYVGNDEFVYYIEDVDGDYDIATVRISVLEYQNIIPIANDDRRGASKNTPVDIDVLINDDGLDDGWIRVFIKENPDVATGSVVVKADNTITFTPATDYLGEAMFKYFITDKDNDTSNVANVNVNVKEINYVPVANRDTISTVMNASILIDVVTNDTGLEDGLDYIKLMNKPLHGFAYVFDNKNIKYFPASWFVGTDSLTYMVVDADGDYGIAKVIITVKDRLDHKPKANPDGRGTSKNQTVVVDVLFNDSGMEDGGLTLILNNLPSNGSVLLNTDNTISYTPATDYLGEDVFYYQLCDFDSDCSSAAVTINVKNANLIPTAFNDTITTYKNRAVVVPVIFNDRNLNDGGISVKVHQKPANGTASVNPDNSVIYTPNTDFFGIDSLWYLVADIDGDYDLAKMVVEVLNRENNIPNAVDDVVETFINTSTLIEVLANDTYLTDGVKSVTIVMSPLNGNCTVDAYNRVEYIPLNGYKGEDSYTYRVCDLDDDCDEATVTITVVPDASKTIDIPEAFSPNGDRINDTFEILNLVNYGRVSIKVYNRWGNLVYKNDRYQNDWDGTSNTAMSIGSKLPDGTYYYIIDFVESGKMSKGSVFIKR